MILTWLIGAVVVGFIGSSISRIGWFMSFFWSLLLSPIVGFIIVLCTQKKDEKILEVVSEIKENISTNTTSSKIEKIKEAKSLLDSGVITNEEFDLLKKDIIENVNSAKIIDNYKTVNKSTFNDFMK